MGNAAVQNATPTQEALKPEDVGFEFSGDFEDGDLEVPPEEPSEAEDEEVLQAQLEADGVEDPAAEADAGEQGQTPEGEGLPVADDAAPPVEAAAKPDLSIVEALKEAMAPLREGLEALKGKAPEVETPRTPSIEDFQRHAEARLKAFDEDQEGTGERGKYIAHVSKILGVQLDPKDGFVAVSARNSLGLSLFAQTMERRFAALEQFVDTMVREATTATTEHTVGATMSKALEAYEAPDEIAKEILVDKIYAAIEAGQPTNEAIAAVIKKFGPRLLKAKSKQTKTMTPEQLAAARATSLTGRGAGRRDKEKGRPAATRGKPRVVTKADLRRHLGYRGHQF